jgi:hypothetical protein
MRKRCSIVVVSAWAVCCSPALADERTEKNIIAAALRETQHLIARELFGHYGIANLAVLGIEDLRGRLSSGRDCGLMRVIRAFSAKRNDTKHPNLNRDIFAPGHAMCQGWLYLHCGVPRGHVFDGRLEVLLAIDLDGSWSAVSPHWRSRREYALDGYLLLEGREKEGYVLFAKR